MQITAEIKGFKAFLILERAFSNHSIEAYLRDVQKFTQFIGEDFPDDHLSNLNLGHFTKFITNLDSLGIAKSSQARNISSLKTFFKYLAYENVIHQNPTELLEAPQTTHKLPEVLSIEEIDAMIAAIDHSKPEGLRNKAIIEVLYGCGLRVSELTGLKLSFYYPELGFLRVKGKGKKDRLVPINATAIKHLDIYLNQVRNAQDVKQGHEDFVFLNRRGSTLSRIMVFNIIKDLATLAGIKKNISPHTFRHSFATHLYDGGADLKVIQEMLGHETIITTEIYTKVGSEHLRDTLTQFHPRF